MSTFHSKIVLQILLSKHVLTLTRPLRKNLQMRWFFDVFKVKESSFFKSNLTDPPLRFLMLIFWKIPI